MASIAITNGNNKVILDESTQLLRLSEDGIKNVVLDIGAADSSGYDGTNSLMPYTKNIIMSTYFPNSDSNNFLWISNSVNQVLGTVGNWVGNSGNPTMWSGNKIVSSIQNVKIFTTGYATNSVDKGRLNIYDNIGKLKWSDKTLKSALRIHYVGTFTPDSPSITNITLNLTTEEANNIYVSFVGGGLGNIWTMVLGYPPSALVSILQLQRTGANTFVATKRTYGHVRYGSDPTGVNSNQLHFAIPLVIASIIP